MDEKLGRDGAEQPRKQNMLLGNKYAEAYVFIYLRLCVEATLLANLINNQIGFLFLSSCPTSFVSLISPLVLISWFWVR